MNNGNRRLLPAANVNFLFSKSTKESLRSNSPVEMETSAEPMDPLTPSVAALAVQPEGECREPGCTSRGLSFPGGSSFNICLVF